MTSPPQGYRNIGQIKCRCINLWTDGRDYWCCNPMFTGSPLSAPSEVMGADLIARMGRAKMILSPPFPPVPDWVRDIFAPLLDEAIAEIKTLRGKKP